jgi:hypothetical protein
MLDAQTGSGDLTLQERRELVGLMVLMVTMWLAWGATFFVVVPSWAFRIVSFDMGALAVFVTTVVAWLLVLARHRMPFRTRALALLAGCAASAIWLPVLWLCAAVIPFAMFAFLLFAIPLALIPLFLWGGFLASWRLSRWAFEVRSNARG